VVDDVPDFRIYPERGGGAKPETDRRTTETHSAWKTGGMRQFPYLRGFRITQIGGGGGGAVAGKVKYGKGEYVAPVCAAPEVRPC
jgi:hypothetical protein